MLLSTDRILTTHVGSLPRPQERFCIVHSRSGQAVPNTRAKIVSTCLRW